MESLLSIIFLIIFVATFSYLGPFINNGQNTTPKTTPVKVQENVSQKQYKTGQIFTESALPAAVVKLEKTSTLINTYITAGPKQGELIEDTNDVVFGFKANVPEENKENVFFETKIEGLDENWKKTTSKQRRVIFPSDPKEYTFFVRAKIGDKVDPTPAQRTFRIDVSPYFKKVKISNIRFENSSNPSLIILKTNLQKNEKINLTGWKIKGKTRSFIIPKGIEKYSPYSAKTAKDNIIAKQGDMIYLSGASNPLGQGINFRPNKCLGYLAENHYFPISFSKNCPKPNKSEIADLDICCQEFILKLKKCEIPNYSKSYSVSGDPECISYLDNNFNYGSCFKKYSNDDNFLEKNWHIYMNRNLLVDYKCDTLYLFDQNGLLVDKYSYGKTICR